MKIWKLLVIVGLLLTGFSPTLAEYLPLRTDITSDKPQIQVLRNDANQVQLEIFIPGIEISQATLEGRNWDRIEIPGGASSNALGAPEIATFSRLVAIPARSGVRAEMQILESETIPNVELMPSQGKDPEDFGKDQQPVQFDMAAYSTDAFYGENEVAVGEPALCRGVRLVPVMTTPVNYNPVTKELRIAHRYRVNLHFEGTDLRNVPSRPVKPMSHAWAKVMRSLIANFDDLNIDEIPVGGYQIVCVNDADLLTRLAPLVEWKKRKGHSVTVSTFVAGSSNTTIKNLILNAYTQWAIPPEYVLLFGDSSGNYSLAGWDPDAVDHPYSQLDGTDVLADLAVGRLPASTTAEADMMVAKELYYEKLPYVTNSNWYHQGLVVADVGHSGISTKQAMRWIKTRMIQHGYTRVDTIWYSYNVDPQQIISSINAGMCYYADRSYLGLGGFGNGNIDQLQNGRQLPFVTIITCGTGGFSGDSNMEHFVSIGTVGSPRGAIGCVGTATWGTIPRFNCTIITGMYAGIFDEDITQAGNALVRGKLELYNAYQAHEPSQVSSFSLWNALAGDPGVDLFTHAIRNMTCTVPDNITWGVNTLTLTVNESSQPLPDATVCLYKANELQSVGETNANGQITLPIGVNTAGNVKVTITKHDFYPIVDSLEVVQANVAVGLQSYTIDDDNVGGSSGDGDGRSNPNENVQLPQVFKNFGSSVTATGISSTASENDAYVTLLDNTETFPDLAPGATGNSIGSFIVQIAANCPNDHVAQLNLVNTASQGTWNGLLEFIVYSYDMQLLNAQASGGDTLIGPGETANLVLTVKNIGDKSATSLTATLTSLSSFVTVNDNSASFGTINSGATGNCSANPFNLTAATNTPPGQKANLKVDYSSSTGATQTDTITIQLGPKSQSDPQGPDAYGYYCFDDTDVSYFQKPTYSWMEINTIGTQLSINDPSENQDASVVVNLPFTFRYYGQNVNSITVCSNGWIATAANASFTDFRNFQIPSCMGPSGMIAPFWDDLVTSSSGKVYSYNDAANHRFIVEWSHMHQYNSSGAEEHLQVLLYDPAYTITPTGDGEIVFQYNIVNDVYGQGDDNRYSTVGIERPDQLDGIEVVYWNVYEDPAAAHLQNGRAYKFTTAFTYNQPSLNLDVNTTPVNPPIVIPANGGNFQYNMNIHNLATTQAVFQVWNKVRDAANVYTTVFGPVTRTLAGGANPTRILTQTIAGSISSGTLYFISYVGNFPTIEDSSFFTITKSTIQDGGPWIAESNCFGDMFDEYQIGAENILPNVYSLGHNYPNPFNPTTVLSYELRAASFVNLSVYDISGRKVAELVNGMREAGSHNVTFDASGLASGIYLYKLEAGDFSDVQKMVLLK